MGLASAASGLLLLFINDPPRGASEPELTDIINEEAAARFTFRLQDLPVLFKVHTWRVMLIQNAIDQVAMAVLYAWAFTWFDTIGLGESGFIAIALISIGNLVGHIFFGWLGDRLEIRFPKYGRAAMGAAGLAVSVPALTGFIALGDRGLGFLLPFGLVVGLSLSSIGSGAQWPITQGVLRPELRASGRAVLDMATGLVGALALSLSGLLVRQFDVGMMLLLLIPLPKLFSTLSWIPVFRTYPRDRQALHEELSRRREVLLDQPGTP
jgi:MFS family permease